MPERHKLDLSKIVIPAEALKLVPGPMARRLGLLPVAFANDVLTVATGDLDDIAALDRLETFVGVGVEAMETDADALAKALKRCYPEVSAGDNTAAADFERILNRAMLCRASDIHVSPTEGGGDILFRVDGRLRLEERLGADALKELVSVVKLVGNMDIAEKRTPQDGNISMNLMGDVVNLRAATIPTVNGEHITLRLLTQDQGASLASLDKLGMSPEHGRLLRAALAEPNGIILLSGPTGSGKTTTLYAALRHLREDGDRHLVSIEDPVEVPLAGVTQIKIDADGERVTFHKALRSVLRHDPDVIMIGEIRDGETADIAVKSALTGHLVLSTLHTNGAAGVLTRLVNLGVEPFLVAATLRLSIAQRLARVPCARCVRREPASPYECDLFGWDKQAPPLLPRATGCRFCGDVGYSGRVGVYEMIPIDNEVKRMIGDGAGEEDFASYAFGTLGLPDLRADGAAKILAGHTTVDEIEAITLKKNLRA